MIHLPLMSIHIKSASKSCNFENLLKVWRFNHANSMFGRCWFNFCSLMWLKSVEKISVDNWIHGSRNAWWGEICFNRFVQGNTWETIKIPSLWVQLLWVDQCWRCSFSPLAFCYGKWKETNTTYFSKFNKVSNLHPNLHNVTPSLTSRNPRERMFPF